MNGTIRTAATNGHDKAQRQRAIRDLIAARPIGGRHHQQFGAELFPSYIRN